MSDFAMESARNSIVSSFQNPTGIKATGPLASFRAGISAIHAGHPQNHALAMMHINEIENGIEKLAALGHRLKLVHVAPDEVIVKYPKMLVHPNVAPGEMLVHSGNEETRARADGWRLINEVPDDGVPESVDQPVTNSDIAETTSTSSYYQENQSITNHDSIVSTGSIDHAG